MKNLENYFSIMEQTIKIPEYNNATIVSQYIMDVMKSDKISLAKIESCLRYIQSRVYLIGLPLEFFIQELYSFKIMHPFETKPLKYALWIELAGKEALDQLLERNHLSDVDRSLENTGFLGLKT